jgi:hypothetical protein
MSNDRPDISRRLGGRPLLSDSLSMSFWPCMLGRRDRSVFAEYTLIVDPGRLGGNAAHIILIGIHARTMPPFSIPVQNLDLKGCCRGLVDTQTPITRDDLYSSSWSWR